MPKLPIAIGSYAEQQRFIKRNAAFLREYPKVSELSARIFIRALEAPNQQEVDRLLTLPEDDPAVIAFEDKMMADRVIFYLGRMAVDDFGELLTLAGNGRGFGRTRSCEACTSGLLPRTTWRRTPPRHVSSPNPPPLRN